MDTLKWLGWRVFFYVVQAILQLVLWYYDLRLWIVDKRIARLRATRCKRLSCN